MQFSTELHKLKTFCNYFRETLAIGVSDE